MVEYHSFILKYGEISKLSRLLDQRRQAKNLLEPLQIRKPNGIYLCFLKSPGMEVQLLWELDAPKYAADFLGYSLTEPSFSIPNPILSNKEARHVNPQCKLGTKISIAVCSLKD